MIDEEKAVDTYRPSKGDFVYDTERHKVAEVQDVWQRSVFLRPKGGGLEWHTGFTKIRKATTAEMLSARVTKINDDSKKAPRA